MWLAAACAPGEMHQIGLLMLVVMLLLHFVFSVWGANSISKTMAGLMVEMRSRIFFRVPIAQFNDPTALKREVAQGFTETFDSGSVQVNAAGENGAGTMRGSALEGSNVDIAEELVGARLRGNRFVLLIGTNGNFQ